MKNILIITLVTLLSCNKNQVGTSDCMCVGQQDSDTIFKISQVEIKRIENRNWLSYNCAEVETGTASVTNSKGNEICENLYSVKCISNNVYEKELAPKFNFYNSEFKNIDLKNNEDSLIFVNQLKKFPRSLYEITLNKDKKVITISKLN